MRQSSLITPDDFEVDQHITVLRNSVQQYHFDGLMVESDYLKGTVLKIAAINLPYLVVESIDPQKGQAMLTVDVREHQFIRLNDSYVKFVQSSCTASISNESPPISASDL